jgi:hypothetical protein
MDSGARGGIGDGPPLHRPPVAFGARRASAPARRPTMARNVHHPRAIPATSGRLDGLLGGCGALLREAIPGGAPHGIVPIETRRLAARYRVLPARRCASSRAQGGPDSRTPRHTKRDAPVGRVQVRHLAVGVGFRSAECPCWHRANGRGERPLPWGSQAPGPERAGGWLRASRAAWRDSVAVRPHGILGKRVTEQRATGTRKAVETTGGDCGSFGDDVVPGLRRALSWSGGAAERDRRTVPQETEPRRRRGLRIPQNQ